MLYGCQHESYLIWCECGYILILKNLKYRCNNIKIKNYVMIVRCNNTKINTSKVPKIDFFCILQDFDMKNLLRLIIEDLKMI
jgi:hypothetical protein